MISAAWATKLHVPNKLFKSPMETSMSWQEAVRQSIGKARLSMGQDDGQLHEILAEEASRCYNAYIPKQTTTESGRGCPILYTASEAEFDEFDGLIAKLHFLDQTRAGVALVTIPSDTRGLGLKHGQHQEPVHYKLAGTQFRIRSHSAQAECIVAEAITEIQFQHEPDGKGTGFRLCQQLDVSIPTTIDVVSPSADVLANQFEHLAQPEISYDCPTYATNKDVEIERHRAYYHLQESSILSPLAGDLLKRTAYRVSGIHSPLLYISEGFGTPFFLHREDADLVALNVVHAGAPKVWYTVAPEHAEKLEACIAQELNVPADQILCDNWVRHLNIFVTRSFLDRNRIHYCVFTQSVNQAVIIFAKAYHQGFNSGPNVAEALNYGDKYWDPVKSRFCKASCPGSTILPSHLATRGSSQAQITLPQYEPIDNEKLSLRAAEDPSTTHQSHRKKLPVRKPERHAAKLKLRRAAPATGILTEDTTRRGLAARRSTTELAPPSHARSTGGSTSIATAGHAKKPAPRQNQRSTLGPTALNLDLALTATSVYEQHHTPATPQKFLQFGKQHRLHLMEFYTLAIDKGTLTGDAESIALFVSAFASVEALKQLKGVLAILRDPITGLQKMSIPGRETTPAILCRFLDNTEDNGCLVALQERVGLARLAQLVDRERATGTFPVGAEDRLKATIVYKRIMAEYSHLPQNKVQRSHESESWYKKSYKKLEARYSDGSRWLRIANLLSWEALFLIPRIEQFSVTNRMVHRLKKSALEVMLKILVDKRYEWADTLSKSLRLVLNVEACGIFELKETRLRLEAVTESYFEACSEDSTKLADLAMPLK